MKRIQVWIDVDEEKEEDVRHKVSSSLDSLHLHYTILPNSAAIGDKEELEK